MKNKVKLENLFVLVTLTFGSLFAILVPPNEIPDEGSHFARVYGILSGNFANNTVKIPESMLVVLSNYSNSFSNGKKIDLDSYLIAFAESKRNTTFVDFYPAASYFPALYLPQTIGFGLGELLKISELAKFFLGRFFNVVLYVFVGHFIVRTIPFAKASFFVLLTMPMSIYLAASYSADAIQIMLTFLYISMVLFELHSQTLMSTARKVAFVIAGSLLALTKPVSLLIIPLSYAIPSDRFGDKQRKLAFVSIQFALGVLFVFLWTKLISSNLAPSGFLPVNVSPAKQLVFIIFNPFSFIKAIVSSISQNFEFFFQSFVGLFGWLTTKLPEFVYFIFVFLLCVALFRDTRDDFRLSKSQRYTFLTVFLLYFIAVMASMYLFWTSLGSNAVTGVQGRYFIPVSPLLFCLFVSSIKNSGKYISNWIMTGLIGVLVPLLLVFSLQTIYLKFYVPCGEYFYDVINTCMLPIGLRAEKQIGEITKPVTQTFTAGCNAITGIELYFGTYARRNRGSMHVSLRDDTSNMLVFEKEINVAKLKDNDWEAFMFPPLQNVSNNKFALTLSPRGSTRGNAVTIWSTSSDIYTQGKLTGVQDHGDLVFRYVCLYGIMHEIRDIGIK